MPNAEPSWNPKGLPTLLSARPRYIFKLSFPLVKMEINIFRRDSTKWNRVSSTRNWKSDGGSKALNLYIGVQQGPRRMRTSSGVQSGSILSHSVRQCRFKEDSETYRSISKQLCVEAPIALASQDNTWWSFFSSFITNIQKWFFCRNLLWQTRDEESEEVLELRNLSKLDVNI